MEHQIDVEEKAGKSYIRYKKHLFEDDVILDSRIIEDNPNYENPKPVIKIKETNEVKKVKRTPNYKHINRDIIKPEVLEEVEENINRGFRVPNVLLPTNHIIENEFLLDQQSSHYNLKLILKHFYNQGRLSEPQAMEILNAAKCRFKKEPNLLRVEGKSYIFGDIHGQFYDLYDIIKNHDKNVNYIFVGDYVDRGAFSVETLFALLLFKLNYPEKVWLLRGNHESEDMTSYFTFAKECTTKYSHKIYKKCLSVFSSLPLALILEKEVFCVHGGISPYLNDVNDINKINRFQEPHKDPLMTDLLWSDPHPFYEFNNIDLFVVNKRRRCSFLYCKQAVTKFLKENGLKLIVRGHEVQSEGYNILPEVITIFSAPNYCDAYKNYGAFIVFDRDITIKKFTAKEHPYILPGHQNVFEWSYPFISEKIAEFYHSILEFLETELEDEIKTETEEIKEEAKKFRNSMSILRNERECLSELENTESKTTDTNSLKVVSNEKLTFEEARIQDIANEIDIAEIENKESVSSDVPSSLTNQVTQKINEKKLRDVIENTEIEDDELGERKTKIPNLGSGWIETIKWWFTPKKS